MIARPERWSPRAEAARAGLAALLAVALFLGAWLVLHRGFYRHHQIVDTPVYQRYGDAIAHGQVPYRDFEVEYPPGALPAFVLPALGHADEEHFDDYRRVFEALMWLCGAIAVAGVAAALRALGASPVRAAVALGFVALAPLALGPVVLSRFDLWPAALVAWALAWLLAGRERLGFGTLALAAATKIYPLVLLPPALAYVWRRYGRGRALTAGGVFLAVLAAVLVPFLALSPGGVWDSIVRQTSRPLQIESLGSAILLAAHQISGLHVVMQSSHGSQNLAGAGPDAVAAVQTALAALALLAVWILFARGPADRERLVCACAASVCAFVALGKVLSPQFLVWLLPLVPLVRGRRGLVAAGLLAAALVLTQLWFPYRYWDLALRFAAFPSWLVLVRDLVLLALLAVLVWPRREPEPV